MEEGNATTMAQNGFGGMEMQPMPDPSIERATNFTK
jgi:hypothetical protein